MKAICDVAVVEREEIPDQGLVDRQYGVIRHVHQYTALRTRAGTQRRVVGAGRPRLVAANKKLAKSSETTFTQSRAPPKISKNRAGNGPFFRTCVKPNGFVSDRSRIRLFTVFRISGCDLGCYEEGRNGPVRGRRYSHG